VTLAIFRFFAIVLTSLGMGLSFAHVMEMPAKLNYDAQLYTAVNSTMYWMFGTVGAVVVVGGVICAIAVAVLARRPRERRPRRVIHWSIAGAALVSASFAAWWVLVFPVNHQIANAAHESWPQMWMRLRLRWEFGHLTVFVLALLGLCALVISVLSDSAGDEARAGLA
jgi:amino acid transporter